MQVRAYINFLPFSPAHFYLIQLTVDLLRKSSSPRLVIVSSVLLRSGRLDLKSVTELTGAATTSAARNPPEYANSKLMNALTAREVLKRYLQNDTFFCKCFYFKLFFVCKL